MKVKLIIFGAGGTVSVILDILKNEYDLQNCIILDDDTTKIGNNINGIYVRSTTESIDKYEFDYGILGVGSVGSLENRIKLYKFVRETGCYILPVISNNCIISDEAEIGYGVTILHNVIVNANSYISNNVLLNTGCIIEHDCRIGESSFISPNATVCGGVTVGTGTFVGAGSVISGGLTIGNDVTIGAGSVVVKDVPDNTILYGNPAHKNMRKK